MLGRGMRMGLGVLLLLLLLAHLRGQREGGRRWVWVRVLQLPLYRFRNRRLLDIGHYY